MAEAGIPPSQSDHQAEVSSSPNDKSAPVTQSIFKNGQYINPWDTWEDNTLKKFLKWVLFDKSKINLPSASELDTTLPVKEVNYEELKQPTPPGSIRVVWIGHASTLVQFDGITILTDPIFSQTCGPKGIIGKKRYRPCPVTVEELPEINAVFTSHNHFDHLDEHTVRALNERFGESLRWFAPLGLKRWFRDTGCENVVEMDWWQESCLESHPEILIAFTPTQHWTRRSARDYCKTLWGSWVIKGPSASFYFAGDTGYCKGFKEIGNRYGPFSLAAIPIGAYEPLWFKKAFHISPEEAAKVHIDVKAQKSLGIHWGTFRLGSEFYLDPPKKAIEAMENLGQNPDDFFTLHHGESKIITA
ncbi:putative N-acyl-phosphatidylethanolamine-hydrolyzing phospholipase D isoform X2 [Apostichopus japonicus]|uniref:N-acetylphosphatidylethanolamine-hydrolyzing phospholipase D n=1 Tax=Stichopus japonicus TaxID=307972 RepID=A0A2G8KPG0_STIJA|nr:putative N-acyl-phosphatidylethanolamine-hydrolyzing phospholipase D isoform X2 [Apostichopus japonicus]